MTLLIGSLKPSYTKNDAKCSSRPYQASILDLILSWISLNLKKRNLNKLK